MKNLWYKNKTSKKILKKKKKKNREGKRRCTRVIYTIHYLSNFILRIITVI